MEGPKILALGLSSRKNLCIHPRVAGKLPGCIRGSAGALHLLPIKATLYHLLHTKCYSTVSEYKLPLSRNADQGWPLQSSMFWSGLVVDKIIGMQRRARGKAATLSVGS